MIDLGPLPTVKQRRRRKTGKEGYMPSGPSAAAFADTSNQQVGVVQERQQERVIPMPGIQAPPEFPWEGNLLVPVHPGTKVKRFDITQEGSDVTTAFTVARERDLWTDREDIALKDAFIIANRPKGVSAGHFHRWMQALAEDPKSTEVPAQHIPAVAAVLAEFMNPAGLAVAIECSWSETTQHLWAKGHEIKRGKRRPNAYLFVGSVRRP
jgi:hypothetical protein